MRIRTPLYIGLVLFAIHAAPAQGTFPPLSGETLDGRARSVPDEAAHGYTLVILAFGKGAQKDLEAWYEPAYLRFIAKHGLMAATYNCEVWFVPVFVGVNKAAYEPTIKRLRRTAEPGMADHVLFFKGEFDPIREQLGLQRNDVPYFFVVDASGHIVHRTEGAFSVDKLDAIEEAMLE